MGIPAAYLTEVNNVEFAKALSMQNARFIRDIVTDQGTVGYGYSELIRKIYIKKHGRPANEEDTAENSVYRFLDVDSLTVSFPSPVSLNMSNLNDQIGNLSTLTDSLSDVLDVPEEDKAEAQTAFKREMFRKFLPNVSWEDVDEIVGNIMKKMAVSKIDKKMKSETQDEAEDSSMDAEV